MSNIAILIPARLQSKRLPGKLMLPLGGSTVLGQCLMRVKSAANQHPVVVVTDSDEIAQEADRHCVPSYLTRDEFVSGSDRIAHVAAKRNETFILNVQADEAFVDPETIERLIKRRLRSSADIVSCMAPVRKKHIFSQPSVVKVVCDNNDKALYFSRASIPFHRHEPVTDSILGFAHIGLYAYKREALLRFSNLEPSKNEQREGLEQLRALDNGMLIEMIRVENETLSIDTREDYEEALIKMDREQ